MCLTSACCATYSVTPEPWEGPPLAHLEDEADLLPGPRADVGRDRLRHQVQLVRVQARPVLDGKGIA